MPRCWALLLAAFGLVPAARAQSPPSVTFRSGVELVRLDVQVTDAAGRPVPDLRAEDLLVTEEGVRRPIVLFQHVEEPQGSYLDIAARTIGAEVSTNRGAPRGHLYVLVFDQEHLTPGREQRVRQAAERFLRRHVRPGDRVAVYGLPGPGPRLRFTADVERAIAELAQVRGALERSAAGVLGTMRVYEAYQIARGNEPVLTRVAARLAAEGAPTDIVRAGGTRTAAFGLEGGATVFPRLVQEDARTIVRRADEAARRFLLMLTDLMEDLRPIEGRKTILLVSEGFFADNLALELERAAAAAARSASVIYSLDVNRRADALAASGPLGADEALEILDRVEPLGSLAAETDGELAHDAGSRLDEVFDRIARRSLDYYIVGFPPSERALANRSEYRRVRVAAAREGVRVSARTGYALDTTTPTPADRRRAIDLALAAPFPRQELPIEFTTYVLRGQTPGAQRVVLSLVAELPLAGPAAQPADVVFVVRRASDGGVAASGSGVMPLPEVRVGGSSGPARYKVQFEVPPGSYLMRVVVREPGGLLGSADRRFEVQPLETREPTASDLVFSTDADGGLAVRPAAYTGGVLRGAMEVYAGGAGELEGVAVDVDLVPLGGAAPVTTVRAEALEVRATAVGATRPVRIEIPLDGVPPGEYVARARVVVGGEAVVERTRAVEVLAGLPPPAPVSSAAPSPREVVHGEPVRALLHDMVEAFDGAVARAARLALAGYWDRVEPLVAAGPIANTGPACTLRGLARLAAGDFDQAVPALEAAAAVQADDARLAFALGWAYAGRGDEPAAIGAWRHAVQLDPTLLAAHLAIADAFIRRGESALARQAVRAGLAALPRSPELLDRLAQLERRE
jgi:VWFA-related protein